MEEYSTGMFAVALSINNKKGRKENIRGMVKYGMMGYYIVIKNVYEKVFNNMRKYKCYIKVKRV